MLFVSWAGRGESSFFKAMGSAFRKEDPRCGLFGVLEFPHLNLLFLKERLYLTGPSF